MSDTETPALAAEGTDTPAPEATPTETAAPAPPARDPEHNRRVIDAAKAERRRVEADRAAKEHTSRISEERKAFEAERAAFVEERKAIEDYKSAMANGRRNPLGILKAAGLTLEDVVRAQLADGEPTADLLVRDVEQRSSAESKAIREEVERLRKQLEDRDAREQSVAQERAVAQIRTTIDSHLRDNADKYELITALEQESEVFDLMRLTFQERNQILSVAEAADMIEDFLDKQAERAARTKKVSARFTAGQSNTAAPKHTTTADARASKSVPTATLTNKQVTSPATPTDATPLETAEEFQERAAKKLREMRQAKASAKK